ALPANEQPTWRQFWADVDQLLQQAKAEVRASTFKGTLTAAQRTQVHELKLQAGAGYIIEMHSTELDSYLKLLDKSGTLLLENDDIARNNRGARLIFTPKESATFRILATSFQELGRGAYTLTVRSI